MNVTEPRGGSLSALVVGLDGDLATVCTPVLEAAGQRVVRDAQRATACQRIPVMQPYLVVLPCTLGDKGREAIEDRTTLAHPLTNAAEKAITRAS
jgi:hypothetical protein